MTLRGDPSPPLPESPITFCSRELLEPLLTRPRTGSRASRRGHGTRARRLHAPSSRIAPDGFGRPSGAIGSRVITHGRHARRRPPTWRRANAAARPPFHVAAGYPPCDARSGSAGGNAWRHRGIERSNGEAGDSRSADDQSRGAMTLSGSRAARSPSVSRGNTRDSGGRGRRPVEGGARRRRVDPRVPPRPPKSSDASECSGGAVR
jgi:hypothetical protein